MTTGTEKPVQGERDMKSKGDPLFVHHVPSLARLFFISALAGGFVVLVAIFFQWLVYDDWLHDQGPLRLIGSFLAGVVMFAVTLRRQMTRRQREIEIQRHLQTLLNMNDRIRNSLQTIECVTYAASPEATESVREAVDTIEDVLEEMMVGTHPVAPSSHRRDFGPAKTLRIQE